MGCHGSCVEESEARNGAWLVGRDLGIVLGTVRATMSEWLWESFLMAAGATSAPKPSCSAPSGAPDPGL